MRIPVEAPTEDEWDPQGLNSIAKEDLESFSKTEEEEEPKKISPAPVVEVDPADDIGRDGLAELEAMEQRLRAEEPILDFAMITEEE